MKEFWKWCLAGAGVGIVYGVFNHVNSPLPIIPEGYRLSAVIGEIFGSAVGGGFFAAIAFRIYVWRRKKPYE